MKNNALRIVTAVVLCGVLGGLAACGASGASGEQTDLGATGNLVSDESTLSAAHVNGELNGIADVSYETCTPCHGGDYEGLIAATEEYWPAYAGQSAANPHAEHGSVAYECTDCHRLAGESIVQCNGCHNFELPDGWVSKEWKSTANGLLAEEGLGDPESNDYDPNGLKQE